MSDPCTASTSQDRVQTILRDFDVNSSSIENEFEDETRVSKPESSSSSSSDTTTSGSPHRIVYAPRPAQPKRRRARRALLEDPLDTWMT
ncbi:hypothetical protein M5689_018757 [Euphorbia peplus]|nr:hypothetical protein M5689_018757 [Euphorbia peplus]